MPREPLLTMGRQSDALIVDSRQRYEVELPTEVEGHHDSELGRGLLRLPQALWITGGAVRPQCIGLGSTHAPMGMWRGAGTSLA